MPTQEDSDVILGDPTDFAIRAGVEPNLPLGSPLWGHMCVWCDGVCLGDINSRHCGLYSAFCGFESLAEHLHELWDERFDGLEPLAIWSFLDERLYGWRDGVDVAHETPLEHIEADAARYGKFDFLTNWDEPFDRHKAFILRSPNTRTVWVLVRRESEPVVVLKASAERLLTVSRAFVEWFRQQERRLRGQP